MIRLRSALALALAVGCSPKAPPPEIKNPDTKEAGSAVATAGSNAAPSTDTRPPMTPADQREAELAKAVAVLLKEEHLLGKPIDDELSKAAFVTYLERVDASKLFLLKGDRDQLAKHADKLDDELLAGRLDMAHEGEKIFVARATEIEGWVNELLAKPMNFSDDESVELESKKVEPATTEAELKDRWRKRLELEVLDRVGDMEDRLARQAEAAKKKTPPPKKAAGAGSGSAAPPVDKNPIPDTAEKREEKARTELAKSYAGRFARLKNPGPLEAASDVVNSITTSLDPHTDYLPPADKANFDIHLSGQLEGIGAVLREKDHDIEIVELVPGGAAYRQGGVTAGDIVLSVTQDGKEPVETTDMRIDDVVKMIRGPKGTIVHLHLKKAAGNEVDVVITRDKVELAESYAKGAMIQASKTGPAFGYIMLPGFYGGRGNPHTAAGDVRKLILECKARKAAGVILDLRGNGGGILGDAVEMTGELIDHGPVVQVQGHGKKDVLADNKPGIDYDGPVVVMIDQFSASASEIVAGALQDYHRAIIVGSTTHGKGTVQSLEDLAQYGQSGIDIGALKITIQQFFRPDGSSTQMKGVVPDIALPNPAEHIESREVTIPHAIPWSQLPVAPHDDWKTPWNITELAKASAARVAKDPFLAKVVAGVSILKARKDDTNVPLSKAKYDARRKAQKAEYEAAIPDTEKAPVRLTVVPIDHVITANEKTDDKVDKTAKPDDRVSKWRENLSRDAWVTESLEILADMAKTAK